MITRILRPLASRVPNITRLRCFATFPDTEFVLAKDVGDKGVLIYNRPQVLNAKNLDMEHKIEHFLNKWKNTKSMIIIKSNCKKAFCVGGDLKGMSKAADGYGEEVFKIEYVTNHIIGSLTIPYVALIDGITMGGGAGSAVHGRYRIATEKTVFAMPEAAVGMDI